MDHSNSFLSPYKFLPMAQENKYLGKCSYVIMKLYVVCTYWKPLIEAYIMSTLNKPLFYRRSNEKNFPKLSPFASWPGVMIKPQWLDLSISRTNFHGPNDVRCIEVRLYVDFWMESFWPDQSLSVSRCLSLTVCVRACVHACVCVCDARSSAWSLRADWFKCIFKSN